jgi:hypothetical protein
VNRRKVFMIFFAISKISNTAIKPIKIATLLYLTAAIVTGCELSRSQRGKVVDTWEATNGSFRIQIEQYEEQSTYPAPAGAYYVFRSAVNVSDSWNEIMTFRHDDPVPIPRDHVHFVNEQVAYVFMGWLYAVTTDGGRTWSVWNGSKDPAFSKTYNYKLIREVSISSEGNGKMLLKLIGDTKVELKTKDYGRRWAT